MSTLLATAKPSNSYELTSLTSSSLIFQRFKDNPYFTNKCLIKKVSVDFFGNETFENPDIDWTDMEKMIKCRNEDGFIRWVENEVDPKDDEIGNVKYFYLKI